MKLKRGAALPLSVGLAGLMLAALFSLLTPRAAEAGGVVTICDQAHLATALAGGGSVTFNCGAPATIIFSSQIVITQPTTIDGGALGQVTLSGNNVTRLFSTTLGTPLTLLNLTLRDADSGQSDGGALWAGGPTTIANSAFISNATSDDAGAIYAAGAPLTVTDSLFHHNLTPDYGGALLSVGPVWVTNSEFYSNIAESGGALALEAEAYITGSHFYQNTALVGGGALYAYNSGAVQVAASQFYSNQAIVGGALAAAGLSLQITGGALHHNTAGVEGGALYSDGLAVIDGTEFYSNTAEYGGAISAYDRLTLTHSSLHHNAATEAGGALGLYFGSSLRAAGLEPQAGTPTSAILQDVAIYNNQAVSYGGGIDFEATWLDVVRTRIYANRVLTGNVNYAGGGLALFYGTTVLTDSAVYGNVAQGGPGGGIHASYAATLTVVSSAVYSNTAPAGQGGGISALSDHGLSPLRIVNSTVAGNTALVAGGVYLDPANTAVISYTTLYGNLAPTANQISATAALHAVLIAGSGGQNCLGSYKSYGYNLEDGDTCDLMVSSDLTNTNPLLGPLAWYGGPTLSLAPLAGSPAIDAADTANCPAADQRGAARPVDGDNAGGAACDIGAYEFGATVARLFLPLATR
ncbi:MAG: hypothetical protein IT317_16580 [Anaerolineales bacterium]|nr:hypothetical protein [Anaerolineales bacterium]